MAGDTINVHTSSWYKLNGVTPDPPANPLTDIVSVLTASVPLASGGKVSQTQLTTTVLNPSVNGFLNTRDATANTARPNAWLNIIVFDEQMNLVNTSDGKNTYYEQVGGGNTSTVKQYNISQREITKSGYVYIYVSNETPNVNVYWDNLQVTHIRGPLLQEQSYYPFGLEMKAISSQAFVIAISAKQSYKFNGGTELNESFDVDYYETYFRNYDAQIGRFTGIDALAEANINQSPYAFANNDPIYFNDPTGLDAWDQVWQYDLDHPVGTTPNGPPIDGGGGINDYGGTLSFNNDGTFTYTPFSSSFEEFMAGATYADTYNLWGQYGFANSWESAAHEYSQTYHETPLRPVAVTADRHLNYDWADMKRQLEANGFMFETNVSPWKVGWEWLTGTGPNHRNFTDGDYFTELLKQHEHIADTRKLIVNNIINGGPLTRQ